jgi:gluconolactonase
MKSKVTCTVGACLIASALVLWHALKGDGILVNRSTLATLQSGNGDGSAVDSAGRLYVTAGATVQVFDKDGKFLGSIPMPMGVISVAFAGPDRKTLYIVANGRPLLTDKPVIGVARTIYRMPMIAQGLKNRGK